MVKLLKYEPSKLAPQSFDVGVPTFVFKASIFDETSNEPVIWIFFVVLSNAAVIGVKIPLPPNPAATADAETSVAKFWSEFFVKIISEWPDVPSECAFRMYNFLFVESYYGNPSNVVP